MARRFEGSWQAIRAWPHPGEEFLSPRLEVPADARVSLTSPQARAVSGTGRPLSRDLRERFEPYFGVDFSRVRIHDHREAHRAAASVNAWAYTLGSDIAFASGHFAPGTAAGRRLIAHELAHVTQQARQGAVFPGILRNGPTPVPPPFPTQTLLGLPMLEVPAAAPSGAAAEAAMSRFESLAATGAGRAELTRLALGEAAAFQGDQVAKVRLFNAMALRIHAMFRSWQAYPVAGPNGSVVFLGGLQRQAGAGYASSIAADGTITTGTYADFAVTDGVLNIDMTGWRTVSPPTVSPGTASAAPPEVVPSPAAPRTAAGEPAPTAPRAPAAEAAPAAPRTPPTEPAPAAPRAPAAEPAPAAPRAPAAEPAPAAPRTMVPPEGEGLAARPGAGVRSLWGTVALNLVLIAVFYLIGRWEAERERERIAALFAHDVDPNVRPRFEGLQARALEDLVTNPFRMSYARIALDIEYTRADAVARGIESLDGASVHSVTYTYDAAERSSQTISEDSVQVPLATTTFVRRVERITTTEPLVSADPTARVNWAASTLVERRRSIADAMDASWPVERQLMLARAYHAAAVNAPDLRAQAADLIDSLEGRQRLEARYGRSSIMAAEAALAQGMGARAAAGRTHWSSEAERIRFVEAYVAVSVAPRYLLLHRDAVDYLRELQSSISVQQGFGYPPLPEGL